MRKTQNYDLPQFDDTDVFSLEDYNSAFDNVDKALSDIQDTINLNENGLLIAQKVNLHDTQLEHIANLGSATMYGVDSKILNNEAGFLLNAYFTSLKSKGLKYANFDENHEYLVNTSLDKASDIVMFGNGKLNSINPNNYFFNIVNNLRSYSGKINTFSNEKSNKFLAFRKALMSIPNIKLCVMGDSISTTVEDNLNIKQKVSMIGSETAPEGLSYGDGYVHRLIDLFTNAYPNRTFDFYARAIGGTNLSQWNTSQTFNSITKTWIEHIKDTNCDVLLIGFGMNHTSYESSFNFAYDLKQMLDYIEANFTKKPDIVFLTSPRSKVMLEDATFGKIESQFAIQNTSDSIRAYATSRGCYIIDVNKLSNVKRTGRTYVNPQFRKINPILSGTFTMDGLKYVLNKDNYLIINNLCKNFSLEFDVEFTGGDSSRNSLFSLEYNVVGLNKNMLFMFPNDGGVGKIESYTRLVDGRWGTPLTQNIGDYSPYTIESFRIEKRDNIIEVFRGKASRRIRDIVQLNNIPGTIKLTNGSSTTGLVVKLSNIRFNIEDYENHLPSITETEMFGDFATPLVDRPLGGGGINHPTTYGVEQCYVPALQEFVNDIEIISATDLPLNSLNLMVKELNVTWSGLIAPSYYYFNLPESLLFAKQSLLKDSTGAYLIQNKNVNSFADKELLANNEFGVYDGQIVINSSTVPTGHKFSSYMTP